MIEYYSDIVDNVKLPNIDELKNINEYIEKNINNTIIKKSKIESDKITHFKNIYLWLKENIVDYSGELLEKKSITITYYFTDEYTSELRTAMKDIKDYLIKSKSIYAIDISDVLYIRTYNDIEKYCIIEILLN